MTDQFVDPIGGNGEKLDFTEHVGQLALIEPHKIQRDVKTQNGLADAVVADVTFIDAPGGPDETLGTWIFTTAIKGKVEDHIGRMVLGRVVHATSKEGRPYVDLEPVTEHDKTNAGAYVAHRATLRASQSFATPAQQQPPQQQWNPPAQQPQQWTPPPAQQPAQQQWNPPAQQQSTPPF